MKSERVELVHCFGEGLVSRRNSIVLFALMVIGCIVWMQRRPLVSKSRYLYHSARLSLTNMIKKANRSPMQQVRAFYFWKTIWSPTESELKALEEAKIQRLYLRVFDVEYIKGANSPSPVAPLRVLGPLPQNLEMVPVVYIKNQVFTTIAKEQIPQLVENVWSLVKSLSTQNKIAFKELQLDCDWSDESRERFFRFAGLLKQKLQQQNLRLTSTIRLHQIKYYTRTGIPPVDRGMLMFYNMGQLKASAPRTSIYNSQDAKLYTAAIEKYPLALDVVLPIFSWVVHGRNGRITGLVEKTDIAELENHKGIKPVNDREFVAVNSFFLHGIYFKAGDTLRVEHVDPALTMEAADLAAQSSGTGKSFETVALFDLDDRNLKSYKGGDYEKVFERFN